MRRFSGVLYDVEIKNVIPSSNTEPQSGITYCQGWSDFEGMGVSCVGAYDFQEKCYRLFLDDNLDEFRNLVESREHVIGFNSKRFDDPLCRAHALPVETTYDLLVEIREARKRVGYPPDLSKNGHSLGELARVNLGTGKSGNGADAPFWWQKKRVGRVADYCLMDVQLTVKLFALSQRAALLDPNHIGYNDRIEDVKRHLVVRRIPGVGE